MTLPMALLLLQVQSTMGCGLLGGVVHLGALVMDNCPVLLGKPVAKHAGVVGTNCESRSGGDSSIDEDSGKTTTHQGSVTEVTQRDSNPRPRHKKRKTCPDDSSCKILALGLFVMCPVLVCPVHMCE